MITAVVMLRHHRRLDLLRRNRPVWPPSPFSAVVALFTFRVVSWQKIEEYVNWGVILMYGGTIALATALEKNGAAVWLAGKGLAGLFALPLRSDRRHLPGLHPSDRMHQPRGGGRDPHAGRSWGWQNAWGWTRRVMTLAIALPAGLAYCLPMGTPATAIVYASGFLKSRDMIVPGVVIMAIPGCCSWCRYFVWPLLGLKI